MATQLQIRRGTSTQVAAFTGAEGEIVVNTTNDSIHVNDGSTAGGFELARADLNNVSDTDLNAALTGNTVSALTITTLTLGSTAITATGTEINLLDGVTATTAELNYVDGVTSNIQTQLDAKAPTANPTFTGSFTSPGIDDNADAIAITIDSSENVGIGTSSPNSYSGYTTLTLNHATSGSILDFELNGTLVGEVYTQDTNTFTHQAVGARALAFRTNSTERLRITSAGAVGIGISNPTEKLTVVNSSSGIVGRFTNNINQTLDLGVISGSGSAGGVYYNNANSGYHSFQVGGSTKLKIEASGDVGIGTSSPQATLHVGDSGATQILVGTTDNSLTTNQVIGEFGIWKSDPSGSGSAQVTASMKAISSSSIGSGSHLLFSSDGGSGATERLRLTSDGNLGLGTSSPAGRLDVRHTVDGSEASPQFRISGGVSTYSAHHWLDATAYYIGQNSSSRKLRIYSGAETAGVNLNAGGTSWGTFSDERLKYDVEPVENALESLSELRTVKYRLKNVDEPDSQKKIGVVAQDLVGVLDEVIDPLQISGDDTEYMTVRYTELVPVLIKAIQEQQETITALEARIAQLENN